MINIYARRTSEAQQLGHDIGSRRRMDVRAVTDFACSTLKLFVNIRRLQSVK